MRISDWSSDVCSSDLLSIQRPLNLTTQGIFNKEDQASTLWEIFSGQKLPPAEALETIHEEIGLGEFGEITEAIVTEEARAIMQRDGFDGVISHFGAEIGRASGGERGCKYV